MTAYRITFDGKARASEEDGVVIAVEGHVDDRSAGTWSTTIAGPEWRLEIRRPTGRSQEASEAAATRAVAQFLAGAARSELAHLDVTPEHQGRWTVTRSVADVRSIARSAADLDVQGTTAPTHGEELDSFTA